MKSLVEKYYDYKESLIIAFFGIVTCIVGILTLHVSDFQMVRATTVMLGGVLSFWFLALAWSRRTLKKFRREHEITVLITERRGTWRC